MNGLREFRKFNGVEIEVETSQPVEKPRFPRKKKETVEVLEIATLE
jgi:hypothetical protein